LSSSELKTIAIICHPLKMQILHFQTFQQDLSIIHLEGLVQSVQMTFVLEDLKSDLKLLADSRNFAVDLVEVILKADRLTQYLDPLLILLMLGLTRLSFLHLHL